MSIVPSLSPPALTCVVFRGDWHQRFFRRKTQRAASERDHDRQQGKLWVGVVIAVLRVDSNATADRSKAISADAIGVISMS